MATAAVNVSMPSPLDPRAFVCLRAGSQTWGGLANSYFWLDQSKKIGGVFMTQILPFGDPIALDLQSAFER